MKRTDYKTYFSRAFMTLAFMGAVVACVEEEFITDGIRKGTGEGLTMMPSVSKGGVVTRAEYYESVEALNEKQLNTLDVFVEHITDGTPDNDIMRQYHLVGTDIKEDAIGDQVKSLLANNWRAEGLLIGEKYNVYVAVNNPLTKETITTVEALKAQIYNEVTDGKAVIENGNIAWPGDKDENDNYIWASPSGNIYKQYVPAASLSSKEVDGTVYAYTSEKEFMMDGMLEEWSPDENTRDQIFDNVTLNRAAAKIVLNAEFDEDFLNSLIYKQDNEGNFLKDEHDNLIEKEDKDKIFITGTPAWRFYNFAFGAPVFDPGTDFQPVEVHNSATLLRHPDEYAGNTKQFQIITYSYPNKWTTENHVTAAPSLVVSVGYSQYKNFDEEGNGIAEDGYITTYNYYRIPIVKSDVTVLERNHIYVINATIATRGSAAQEDEDVTENINYAVLPWNDESNSNAIHNEVKSVQNYYFNVNPKVYTLRGDGPQSVTLSYSKATGTKVSWKLFAIDTTTGAKGAAVESSESSAVWGWYYNSDGVMQTTYNDGSEWNHLKVEIEQSGEGTSGSNGTIDITSTALTNKAIKYMLLRVYLDEEETFDSNGNPTYYEDILIRHFPTDNIQSFTGSWSSYHDADGATKTVTTTLYDIDKVLQLVNMYGATYTTNENASITDVISRETYQQHSSEEGYNRTATTITRDTWVNAVPQNARQGANSENNAYHSGDYYYWGTGQQSDWRYEYNGYDWYTGYYDRTYYRYTTLNRVQYTHTYTRTSYTVTYETASAGDWVDWDADEGRNVNREYQNDHFKAKVFQSFAAGSYGQYNWGADEYCVPIYHNGSVITYRNPISDGGTYTNLTNNHMYVIQISSTSSKYVIGKPYIEDNVSQDDVVSPAFMIASQLGAVSYYSSADYAEDAAKHCGRYMEVGTDGKRYVGWRLPTAAELKVIGGYQQGTVGNTTLADEYRVISEVLGGPRYFSLDGSYVRTEGIDDEPIYGGGGWGGYTIVGYRHYLRCVRDLSATEIEELNGFAQMQQQYQSR